MSLCIKHVYQSPSTGTYFFTINFPFHNLVEIDYKGMAAINNCYIYTYVILIHQLTNTHINFHS